MEPLKHDLEHWITANNAPQRINRHRSTIYKWIAAGKIRTLQPGQKLWLYLPDLLKTEQQATRRITPKTQETR